MKSILQTIARRAADFESHALFTALKDPTIALEHKLAIVPALSHFVMTFADIYAWVLRDEGTNDWLQRIVNAHAREDGDHWKWYLSDLDKLGYGPRMPFSEALRFVWGERLLRTRMLSYEICRLGLGADPLKKLALVLCIEATGAVTLRHVAPLGEALAERKGVKLTYFGMHHLRSEDDHTLEEDSVRTELEAMNLDEDIARDLERTVHGVFDPFMGGADDLLAHVRSPELLPPSLRAGTGP